jgi:hypothetical protein
VRITGTYAAADYVQAMVGHRSITPASRAITMWVAGLLSFAATFYSVKTGTAIPVLVVLAVVVLALLCKAWLPRAIRREVKQRRAFEQPVEIILDDDGARFISPLDTANRAWSDFQRWQENEHAFRLYESRSFFHFIPMRFLTAEQVAELRILLAAKIPGT